MRKIVFFLLFITIMTHGLVQAKDDFFFKFARSSIFRNSYFLHIKNSSDEVLMFGGYGAGNYYADMNNGSRISLDTKAFNDHYFKGAMWISPQRKGYLPFKINKQIIKNAKKLVFIGEIGKEVKVDCVTEYHNRREFIISVDLNDNSISYKIGKELPDNAQMLSEPFFPFKEEKKPTEEDFNLRLDDQINTNDDGRKLFRNF